MIVVIGSPIGRLADGTIAAAGMASRVALAAAGAGRTVQLVGKTGDDPTADGVVLDLARGGVGHVALLRDPARATPLEVPPVDDRAAERPRRGPLDGAPAIAAEARAAGPRLEAADVDLGLRYLTEFAVVVLAEPASPEVVAIVVEAAVGRVPDDPGRRGGGACPRWPSGGRRRVRGAPDADPDGVFAGLVGSFAAALDDGTEPGEAFRASVASDGWTEATEATDRRLAQVSERLDELGSVAPDVVDVADGVDLERDVLVRDQQAEELARIRRGRVQPAVPGVLGDDDRHPVVQVGQGLVRRRRHDREGPPDRVGRRVAPARPQAGERERRPSRRTTRKGCRSLPSRRHS